LCLVWSRPALTAAQIARVRQIIDGDGRSVKEVDALPGTYRQTPYRTLGTDID
jgi:hypothetical protein